MVNLVLLMIIASKISQLYHPSRVPVEQLLGLFNH